MKERIYNAVLELAEAQKNFDAAKTRLQQKRRDYEQILAGCGIKNRNIFEEVGDQVTEQMR